jgi:hypothetical protein
MFAPARLDAGLLVGAQDIVAWSEGKALPARLIKIEDAAGLGGELGIAREDPAAVALRPQGILIEPAPQGRAADLCHLNEVDPQAWLADAFARIAAISQNRLHKLLPWEWKRLTGTSAAAVAA